MGSSCASIQELEAARGSLPIPWQTPKVGQFFAFRSRHFDRDVKMLYLCNKGILVAGNYYLPVETLAEAQKSFISVTAYLTAFYGEPQMLSAQRTLESLPADPRATTVRPHAWWHIGDLSVAAQLMPNMSTEELGWRVFVVIGPKRPSTTPN